MECGTGTGDCVRTDDKLLCARGVLVENLLACPVIEVLLACKSCDSHYIMFCSEQ